MSPRRLLIVGAGLAGMRAGQAARAAGFDGTLTLVGDEPHAPYTRPPLSKELLTGTQTPEQCALPGGTLEAEWRLGQRAVNLDRGRRVVILEDGKELPYDRLIIATGCRARRWPGLTAQPQNLHTLRTLEDSLRLRERLGAGVHLLVLGAGFVGCEVAASARALGAQVTMVDLAPHPMLPLGPELGARCAELHRRQGVELHLGAAVERMHGEIRIEAVELQDGTRLKADEVLVALGSRVNTGWLEDSGLRLEPGVACDETLTASEDPDVLAAGDLVQWPHPLAGGARMRVEHWTVAAEHGQLAGRNALLEPDRRTAHLPAPYFWSDQYDLKIQALGFPLLAERLEVIEQAPEGDRLVAAGAREGRVVGVVGFNAVRRLAFYRRELAEPVSLEELRRVVEADEKAFGPPAQPAHRRTR
jgi:3-phenylpropionate/trans-cinnamate dioxygenase ferredoxin reductase subunit